MPASPTSSTVAPRRQKQSHAGAPLCLLFAHCVPPRLPAIKRTRIPQFVGVVCEARAFLTGLAHQAHHCHCCAGGEAANLLFFFVNATTVSSRFREGRGGRKGGVGLCVHGSTRTYTIALSSSSVPRPCSMARACLAVGLSVFLRFRRCVFLSRVRAFGPATAATRPPRLARIGKRRARA